MLMINKFNSIKNFYLKESKKLDWLKKPKIVIRKDKKRTQRGV